MSKWVRLGTELDFDDKIRTVEFGHTKILVVRLQGEVFAFNGICPHAAGPLARGETDGQIVTCPLHGWRFDLCDKGREIHGYRPLRMYEVKKEGAEVLVHLSGRSESRASN